MNDITPAHRTALRCALDSALRAVGLPSDFRELAHELVADLQHTQNADDPFFAHNLAVFVTYVARDKSLEKVVRAIADAAKPFLVDALAADADDLALALAIASVPSTIDSPRLIEQLAEAANRPHAGDRLIARVGEAFAQLADEPPNAAVQQAIPDAASRLIERLDLLNSNEPDRENLVEARLALMNVIAKNAGGQAQTDAYERLDSLFEAADRHFGPTPERGALYLRAICGRLAARGMKTSKALTATAVRNAVELAEQGLYPSAVTNFVNVLHAKNWLSGQRARDLSSALSKLSEAHPNDTTIRDAHTRSLEATGDDSAVVSHHADLVKSSRAGDDSSIVLARHWIHRLEAGASSGLDAETEHWVASNFPQTIASSLSAEIGLLLLERVAAASGPTRAGHLGATALLSKRPSSSQSPVVVRTVQLLADGGEPERALSVGHKHLKSAGNTDLRLTLAKIHIGAAIRIAEAESLLRPLASESGAVAAEARALRDQVVNHPSYEIERHSMMLDVERRIGVDTEKAIRCRVLFPSDRYVLAEMPSVRAPAFYQHRYLRVMVTDKSLPEGLVLSDMPKGTEFTAKVIGEDDNRGDRIRIYWVGDEPIELIARPPQRNVAVTETDTNQAPETTEVDGSTDSNTITSAETTTPPTALSRTEVDPALEERFGIGGESPVKIRIDKVMLRRGLLLGRILASDDSAEEFPHRVGIHRRFIPDTLKKARFKGAIVQTTVVRADTAKLRYDATAEFTIITPAPESKQATPSVSANELSGDSTDEHASSSPVDNIQEPAHQPVEITDDQTNVGSQADSPPPTQSLDNDAKPTTEATESDD